LEKEVKQRSWLGEVHRGDEGSHWTVVPSKKKKYWLCKESRYGHVKCAMQRVLYIRSWTMCAIAFCWYYASHNLTEWAQCTYFVSLTLWMTPFSEGLIWLSSLTVNYCHGFATSVAFLLFSLRCGFHDCLFKKVVHILSRLCSTLRASVKLQANTNIFWCSEHTLGWVSLKCP